MSDADRVTIKAFDTTDEAKDAERLLLDYGLSKDVVSRKGKKLRVAAEHEDEARSILAGGVSGMLDAAQAPLHTVADGAQAVAGSVANAAQSATSAVSHTVQSATSAVADQVGATVDAASGRVAEFATTVREYGADTSGVPRKVVQTTANALDRTAYYLREGDINVVLDDLRNTIRRHPGRSLLLGLGLGFLARSTLDDSTADGHSARASNSSDA